MYQFGTIDSGDFCYPYWMSNYLTSLWKSADLVRQSVVPSAMVDGRGDLFTMSLWGMNTSGAQYNLQCFKANGKTISSTGVLIYPWTQIESSINVTKNPSGLNKSDCISWFNRYVFNAFQPCIAQDV